MVNQIKLMYSTFIFISTFKYSYCMLFKTQHLSTVLKCCFFCWNLVVLFQYLVFFLELKGVFWSLRQIIVTKEL